MENMELWNRVKSVPEDAQKKIGAGRLKGMTDINPQWRLEVLTEQFGACGFGWYYDIINKWIETGANGEITANVEIKLFVKYDGEWSKGISGIGGSKLVSKETGGMYTSDECYKMALTDAISVACKQLGIGADIYRGFTRTKYSSEEDKEEQIVGGSFILNGGKYNGKTIDEVLETDEEYIRFCIINAKNETAKANMAKALADAGLPPVEVEL